MHAYFLLKSIKYTSSLIKKSRDYSKYLGLHPVTKFNTSPDLDAHKGHRCGHPVLHDEICEIFKKIFRRC